MKIYDSQTCSKEWSKVLEAWKNYNDFRDNALPKYQESNDATYKENLQKENTCLREIAEDLEREYKEKYPDKLSEYK
jgi:hypothetical protein